MTESTITRVYVQVDRAAAIRRGINGTESPVQVELDVASMTQEQRDMVAECFVAAGESSSCWPGGAMASVHQHALLRQPSASGKPCKYMVVTEPTQAGVIAVLDGHAAAKSNAAAAAKEEADRLATYAIQQAERVLADKATVLSGNYLDSAGNDRYWDTDGAKFPDGSRLRNPRRKANWPDGAPESVTQSDTAKAWLAEIEEANRVAVQQELARYNDAWRVVRQERTTWIAHHGSRRLQRMVAESIDHEETYQRERQKWDRAQTTAKLAQERPGWTIIDPAKVQPAKDVPDSALAILDAARAIAPTARLGKVDGRWVAVEVWGAHTIYWPRD